MRIQLFIALSVISPALVSAQMNAARKVFPTETLALPPDSASANFLTGIDVTASTVGDQIAISAAGFAFAGPARDLSVIIDRLREVTLPDGSLAWLDYDETWALADGRAAGSPEIGGFRFAYGLAGPSSFTPLFWSGSVIPEYDVLANTANGLSVSDHSEHYTTMRIGIAGSGMTAFVRFSPDPQRSYLISCPGVDPAGRDGLTTRSVILGPIATSDQLAVFGVSMSSGAEAWFVTDGVEARVLIDSTSPVPPPLSDSPNRRFRSVIRRPSVNASGDVLLLAEYSFVGGYDGGLFRWRDGELSLLFTNPTPVPSLGTDVAGEIVRSPSLHPFLLTPRGDAIFALSLRGASINSSNDFMLVSARDGVLTPIYREGEPVPGLPPGSVLSNVHPIDFFQANARGQLIFRATTGEASVVLSWSPVTGLRKLIATGDRVDFDGAPRAISGILAPNVPDSNGEDHRPSLLSPSGTAYIPVQFADNTWALYAIDVPDPCPIDMNADGFIDFFDYNAFVIAFETGDQSADFNADGFLDLFDYLDFTVAFERGC